MSAAAAAVNWPVFWVRAAERASGYQCLRYDMDTRTSRSRGSLEVRFKTPAGEGEAALARFALAANSHVRERQNRKHHGHCVNHWASVVEAWRGNGCATLRSVTVCASVACGWRSHRRTVSSNFETVSVHQPRQDAHSFPTILRAQNAAMAFSGNPVPPVTGTGAIVIMNSQRCSRAAVSPSASRS